MTKEEFSFKMFFIYVNVNQGGGDLLGFDANSPMALLSFGVCERIFRKLLYKFQLLMAGKLQNERDYNSNLL